MRYLSYHLLLLLMKFYYSRFLNLFRNSLIMHNLFIYANPIICYLELEVCTGQIFQTRPGLAQSKEKKFWPGQPERQIEI